MRQRGQRVGLAVGERLVLLGDAGLRVLAARRAALAVGVAVDGAHGARLVASLGKPGRDVVVVGGGCVAAFGHGPRIPSRLVVITFLSDYGSADDFVGVCHAVMARIAPDVRVVDLTHGIARHDLRTGALVLRRTLPFAGPGVHLAVVDPEVGGRRRAVAIRCAEEDRLLVGPDNGLLLPAAERFGGVVEAVELSESPHRLRPVSATFHGRDLFAPVAAHLATGAPLGDAGQPLEPGELVPLELPAARVEAEELVTHVLAIDRFGNLALDAGHEQITASGLRVGQRVVVGIDGEEHDAHHARTFTDVGPGELLLYEDAYRTLALAVNRGSAADRIAVGLDDELRIRPA